MRERMSWDSLKCGERCVVYTSFIELGVFRARIMIGKANKDGTDNLGPSATPWLTGTVTNCKSHAKAFDAVFGFVQKNYKPERDCILQKVR